MDRRNFLLTIIRGSVLVGLAATSGYLISKKEGKNSECNAICRSCRDLHKCAKPEAIEVKKELTRR